MCYYYEREPVCMGFSDCFKHSGSIALEAVAILLPWLILGAVAAALVVGLGYLIVRLYERRAAIAKATGSAR